jgi:hypothetical protein
MRLTSSDGETTVETDSNVEATQLRAQGYQLVDAKPAKNKARTSKSTSTKARSTGNGDAPTTDS